MNEEEIINILTDDIVALNVGYEKYEEAVQGLLNLYNKEKERNKDLEQIEQEHKEENGRLRDRTKELEGIYNTAYNMGKSYINIKWKSKIKEKIEELNKEEKKELKGTKGQDRYSIKLEYMHKRNALQELLEESEK